jgi:hypothetical protein
MPRPDDLEQLRSQLRRVWRRAHAGPWEAARVEQSSEVRLYAAGDGGGQWLIACPNRLEDAQLAAAAVNALPRLWQEIDRLRAGVPVLGVVEDGRVAWTVRAPVAPNPPCRDVAGPRERDTGTV